MSTQQTILKALHDEAMETQMLFSNAGQNLQERTVVAGFLRVLGIEFRDNEIVKKGPEPIDVWFRDAHFQVTEILDEGRPRNLEIKRRADRIKKAKSLNELIEPGIISSRPISLDELVALVSPRRNAKARHYGRDCSGIDLLVYVNLKGRHLFPFQPFSDFPEGAGCGWRSVSVIMEHFAIVLWATADAPLFLIQRRGQALHWDKGPESVFPILDL